MGKTVGYQGYTIQSAPHHLKDGEKKWRLRILISLDDRRTTRTHEFSADVVYATEDNADTHGIALGRRLIDGKVEDRSVMYMRAGDRRAMPRLADSSFPS